MKKTCTIFSAILIGCATIGFIVLPHYFDPKLASMHEERELLAFDEDRVILNQKTGEFNYTTAIMQRDHADILRALNRAEAAQQRDDYKIEALRGALISAIKAAQVARSISSEEEKEFSAQAKDLNTYPEIYPRYIDFLIRATKGCETMRTRSFELKNQIRQMEKRKSNWWLLCLVLQSGGIVSSAIAVCLPEKKGKNPKIAVGSGGRE